MDDDISSPADPIALSIVHSAILFEGKTVCNFSYTDKVHPVGVLLVNLNFDEATKVLPVIRMKLVQLEQRRDGSRVQVVMCTHFRILFLTLCRNYICACVLA